ncbi:hypothetical protein BKA70DRAFT_1222933 [Coprinopsis sp. MPI-PUGE-AT-0042]|nr:hypothetical protein BKA70DRAFT_1222933 [Coprinopsis sp. MPI-PUGE-AT-0042]
MSSVVDESAEIQQAVGHMLSDTSASRSIGQRGSQILNVEACWQVSIGWRRLEIAYTRVHGVQGGERVHLDALLKRASLHGTGRECLTVQLAARFSGVGRIKSQPFGKGNRGVIGLALNDAMRPRMTDGVEKHTSLMVQVCGGVSVERKEKERGRGTVGKDKPDTAWCERGMNENPPGGWGKEPTLETRQAGIKNTRELLHDTLAPCDAPWNESSSPSVLEGDLSESWVYIGAPKCLEQSLYASSGNSIQLPQNSCKVSTTYVDGAITPSLNTPPNHSSQSGSPACVMALGTPNVALISLASLKGPESGNALLANAARLRRYAVLVKHHQGRTWGYLADHAQRQVHSATTLHRLKDLLPLTLASAVARTGKMSVNINQGSLPQQTPERLAIAFRTLSKIEAQPPSLVQSPLLVPTTSKRYRNNLFEFCLSSAFEISRPGSICDNHVTFTTQTPAFIVLKQGT